MDKCNHSIVWATNTMEIRSGQGESLDDEFDEAVEFTGRCTKCKGTFLKTYLDPRYSRLKGKLRELENAWRENIKSQKFVGSVQQLSTGELVIR